LREWCPAATRAAIRSSATEHLDVAGRGSGLGDPRECQAAIAALGVASSDAASIRLAASWMSCPA